MTTPREEDLRRRERELKERELELRLRELDAEVQTSAAKEPEVQTADNYTDTNLEDASPGRSLRRRWRRFVTIAKFVGLAVISIAAVSVAFWLGLIVIGAALAYAAFQIFLGKER